MKASPELEAEGVTEDEMQAALELCERIAGYLGSQSYAVRLLGDVQEVAQIGAIGILKAAQTFDRSRGVKFAAYAGARIRGEILDAARNVGFIKTPRLAQQRGEGSKTVGSLEAIRTKFLNDAGNPTGYEPSDRARGNPDAEYAVERFLQTLTRRERSIVRLYFGFGSGMPLTMKEIAALHGLSESRVSQLMTQILARATQNHHLAELN